MSRRTQPSEYEKEIEEHIAEQETEKTDAEKRNPTLDSETFDLNVGYDFYLERTKDILKGISEHDYGNNHQVIEHVIQSNYDLNTDYVKFIRKIIEDSIKMRLKIEELERRQIEQLRLANLRKNGGKSKRNKKTRKN